MPGRELGRHPPGDGVPARRPTGSPAGKVVEDQILATGKHVVVIGGGDTGADCVGTAHRQGAASVTQLEIMPRPGDERAAGQPWPTYPMIYRVSSAHEEGGERVYAVSTQEFVGDDDGNVASLRLTEVEMRDGRFEPVRGKSSGRSRRGWCCSRWASPDRSRTAWSSSSASSSTTGATSLATTRYMSSVPGVFVAGDAGRGQSLIVWAIAEGRSAAAAVDRYLTGSTTLPAPIPPTARPLMV